MYKSIMESYEIYIRVLKAQLPQHTMAQLYQTKQAASGKASCAEILELVEAEIKRRKGG